MPPYLGDSSSRRRGREVAALPAEEREHDVLDDVARVSPLKHANLNVLSRSTFTASAPAAGALRLLRGPDSPELDEDDDGNGQE
ncbi:hypothetical protein M2163_000496 [Streptomyces sp. SAI-135]|nr:hypothetical protein [Streptomyces sp. SAI-090]MDH6573882.1 hypothetical protein [Streptomyces sp. SAI-117]MDH6581382.1 hypothetical protein [Streptomyces sp. SAI-133]MDH6613388.1 hypothetical protein [Streptomyces sp. SAI-135]